MDHAALIAELPEVEKLPVLKRLELAKKRRCLQLSKWKERDEASANIRFDSLKKGRRLKFRPSIALLDATFRGDYDEVKFLLEAGADPNSRNEDGLTPLHQCCIDDNRELLLLFIRSGADVNSRDTEMWTPLHAAACCGHLNVARVLVEHGADLLAVNADTNMPYDICDDDVTLEYLESQMAQRGVTQEQIDYLRGATERTMLVDMKQLNRESGLPTMLEYCGATPLHIASANGYLSVAQFLLDCGVAVDARDVDSWQPIHAAACWAQPHIIELLVSYGADINATTNSGESPLDLCEEPEVRDVILQLLREHAENMERQHFVRESYRLSRRRKPISKFESPQYTSSQSIEGHHAASSSGTGSTIRRLSLRDKSGSTLARLEARQEALMRTRSLDESDFSPIILKRNNASQAKDTNPSLRRLSEPPSVVKSPNNAPRPPRKDQNVPKKEVSSVKIATPSRKVNGTAIPVASSTPPPPPPPPSYQEAEKLVCPESSFRGESQRKPAPEIPPPPTKPVSVRQRAPAVPPKDSSQQNTPAVVPSRPSLLPRQNATIRDDSAMVRPKPPEALKNPDEHQEWYLMTTSGDKNGVSPKQPKVDDHHAHNESNAQVMSGAPPVNPSDLQYQRLIEPRHSRSHPSVRSPFGCCNIV